jgi:hypothetical protein
LCTHWYHITVVVFAVWAGDFHVEPSMTLYILADLLAENLDAGIGAELQKVTNLTTMSIIQESHSSQTTI